MWHSCARHAIAEHFAGKDPSVRQLFRAYRALVRSLGPVRVYAQKTRIIFQTRARFTGVIVRRQWLDVHIWLKRRLDDRRFRRIEFLPKHDYIHSLRLRSERQLDGWLKQVLREARRVGNQQGSTVE